MCVCVCVRVCVKNYLLNYFLFYLVFYSLIYVGSTPPLIFMYEDTNMWTNSLPTQIIGSSATEEPLTLSR